MPRKIKDIIFGRKTKAASTDGDNKESPEFETSGELEAIEIEQSDTVISIEGEK
ncbi:MAG: hypothetical protein JKX81_18245 [Arenicella sp.]|nr:hypothetical protein [Arenicella sp.]